MIDRARIEQLLAILGDVRRLRDLRNVDRATITDEQFYLRHIAWTKAKNVIERSQTVENQIEILTGYLALLSIIEALAREYPYREYGEITPWTCIWCNESKSVGHTEDCGWAKARELVAAQNRPDMSDNGENGGA